MSGRGVWLRARARLRRFPVLLSGCGEQVGPGGGPGAGLGAGGGPGPVSVRGPVRAVRCRSLQAAAYGRCVAAAAAGPAELRRDTCLEEFRALRDCFTRAVGPSGCETKPNLPHQRDEAL
uniref:Uncharacterized protein n=1 Tax=Melopsittacus undulatus TaxID=13146 RepID=A0A8V5GCC1_MELUD